MSISSEKSQETQQPKGPWSNIAGKGSAPQKKQTPSASQSQTGAIPKTQHQQTSAGWYRNCFFVCSLSLLQFILQNAFTS